MPQFISQNDLLDFLSVKFRIMSEFPSKKFPSATFPLRNDSGPSGNRTRIPLVWLCFSVSNATATLRKVQVATLKEFFQCFVFNNFSTCAEKSTNKNYPIKINFRIDRDIIEEILPAIHEAFW